MIVSIRFFNTYIFLNYSKTNEFLHYCRLLDATDLELILFLILNSCLISKVFIVTFNFATVKPGTNKIERGSHESVYTVEDETPSDVLYKKVVKAVEGSETFTYTPTRYGIPDRLALPKGKKEGMPFKLFVSVSPLEETQVAHMETKWGPSVIDSRPLGWPLDRPVQNFNFTVPNFYMKDVIVHHKSAAEELNLTM